MMARPGVADPGKGIGPIRRLATTSCYAAKFAAAQQQERLHSPSKLFVRWTAGSRAFQDGVRAKGEGGETLADTTMSSPRDDRTDIPQMLINDLHRSHI